MAIINGEYVEQYRCDACGRFIGEDGDTYTVWGSASYDPPEPHDPEDLCGRCTKKLYARIWKGLVERGLPVDQNRPYWQSPQAWQTAKGIYRGMTRHGLIDRPVRHEVVRRETKYGRDQVWYCLHCKRPEKHPAHDIKEAFRLKTRFCKFQKSMGVWIAPNYGRERCACGWASPWVTGFHVVHPTMKEHLTEARTA